MRNLDKYRGCLIGGAAGDALGYPVEFASERKIFSHYGKPGIRAYELDTKGIARFSDDTQMTLYTANGLLFATTRGATRGIMGAYPDYLRLFYKEWYRTQTEPYPLNNQIAWISSLRELFEQRAPGNTCLSACASNLEGTPETPINNSKGCGGVMRVAPVGLYFNAVDGQRCEGRTYSYAEIQRMGAETAAITHGHELGWLPAGVLAHIVSYLAHESSPTIEEAVLEAIQALPKAYPQANRVVYLQDLLRKTVQLSKSSLSCLDAIHELGEGWVAEEALAISVLCALRYPDDFESAVITAVNHSGDSDSTGAITGNIIGTHVGLTHIPEKYLAHLELADTIIEIANDLFDECQISEWTSSENGIWEDKYITADYLNK